MKPIFIGSGVALVTPFHKDGKIDFECFKNLIEFQIANKSDAIIVCGTTGEGSTLTVDEKLQLFSVAAETVKKRVPVIVGTGSNSTSFALKLAKKAEFYEFDAHLVVTPYYNKASQRGIIEHYYTLADNLKKPIIVYNVPSRTGVNVQPETYLELSKHKNIVGVKEADPNIAKLVKSISLCESNLDFYIGNDDLISVSSSLGCKGVISVLSNVFPAFTHEMAKAGIEGKTAKSSAMQKNSINLIEKLFSDVNPIPVKAAMEYLGLCSGKLRLPLSEISEEKREKLIEEIKKFMKENSPV